jgi:hypothetical protein
MLSQTKIMDKKSKDQKKNIIFSGRYQQLSHRDPINKSKKYHDFFGD